MASEFGFLCSSKILVLDNFCNTRSHALPPATRKPRHKTPWLPYTTNHPGSRMGWALPRCRALRGHERRGDLKSNRAVSS